MLMIVFTSDSFARECGQSSVALVGFGAACCSKARELWQIIISMKPHVVKISLYKNK